MSFRNRMVRLLLVIALLIMSMAGAAGAQPDILVQLRDSSIGGCEPPTEIEVAVYLSNFYDTVESFELWFQLDRPDLVRFPTHLGSVFDTTHWLCTEVSGADCVDSLLVVGETLYFQCNEWDSTDCNCLDSTLVPPDSGYDFSRPALWSFTHVDTIEVLAGDIDTAGSLISGWEWVDSRSLSGYGTELQVNAIADLDGGFGPPPHPPGIFPQHGGRLLTLPLEVLDIPDTLTDRTVNILVGPLPGGFFDPRGNPIGWIPEEIPDTNCWMCMAWAGEVCLNWKRVNNYPCRECDSIEVGIDTIYVADTTYYQSGSITILGFAVGDVNDDGTAWNIADLVYLVNFMFQEGSAPPCEASTDCDGDGKGPDIADLICFVNRMFLTPQ